MKTDIEFNARSARLGFVCKQFGDERADLILTLFEDEPLTGFAAEADALTNGMISRRIAQDDFEAKLARARCIDTDLSTPGLDKVILVGLGKRAKLTVPGLRKALQQAFEYCRDAAQSSNLLFSLQDVDLRGLTAEEFAECVAEYATLIDYEKAHRKTREMDDDPDPTHFESLTVLTKEWALSSAKRGMCWGKMIGDATNRARDMVNEPSDVMTPAKLAGIARKIAKESNGRITCSVLNKAKMKALGMNAALAVAKASTHEPCFIQLTYTPETTPTSDHVIGLVGKGVTFDTGGLNLKDDDGMRDMKMDMAGAAAVLSLMSCLPQIKPKVKIVAVVAAVENLSGKHAFRQGDVVKSMSGLTIEIDHTDCEGRLTLADALHYIQEKCGATKVIDLATLTGAVEDALGTSVTGIYGNCPRFTRQFLKAAQAAGEAMYELPLSEQYRSSVRGRMADLTNDAHGPGSIVAALFLQEFVKPETSWIHADIAATAYRREADGVDPEGASGVGVRTLAQLLWQNS